MVNIKDKLEIKYVPIDSLRSPEYNSRIWSKEATEQLTESIKRHGLLDPLLVNDAPGREGVIIGGDFRWSVAKNPRLQRNASRVHYDKRS